MQRKNATQCVLTIHETLKSNHQSPISREEIGSIISPPKNQCIFLAMQNSCIDQEKNIPCSMKVKEDEATTINKITATTIETTQHSC
uniref:Uncharacterized protein n=1 Tax=Rhizophora mucronata TaxID=61149 RepID=A0A2P2NLE2_RHIMU